MAKKLDVFALGIAFGLCFGAYMLIIGLSSWLFNWGTAIVEFSSKWYLGFAPTFIGSIFGCRDIFELEILQPSTKA